MTVIHLRTGGHTACGISLWGKGVPADNVTWVNDWDSVDCPQCVINALPLTIIPPEGGGFKL